MEIKNPFGVTHASLLFPDHTHVVAMAIPQPVADPQAMVIHALEHPIDSATLRDIAVQRMAACRERHNRNATAVIVVSDNTRPVPYRQPGGILMPVVEVLLDAGYVPDEILILVATGTHRAMSEGELKRMLGPDPWQMGIRVVNHDCKDDLHLRHLGKTCRGTEITIDTRYLDADLKIATGLVESHFMAGASGGRKAVCPGLIGEQSTYVFHGAALMDDPASRDLHLAGNPVHEEAVEVASAAPIDFLVNVTVDHSFQLTGVFAGNWITAHEAAVVHLRKSVKVDAPVADIVVTHAGYVGINHYQCAKCAVASLGILKPGGYLVILANTTDPGNPVGGIGYRTTLALLTLTGADAFMRTITSEAWTFIPEQWQVQQWAKVFKQIPMDHLYFYSPSMDAVWKPILPGKDGELFTAAAPDGVQYRTVVQRILEDIACRCGKSLDQLSLCWIADGPYVVPVPPDGLEI